MISQKIFILGVAFVILLILVTFGFTIYFLKRLFMDNKQQFEDVLNRINAATDEVATELREIKEKLQAALADDGLDEDAETEILSRLSGAADRLEGVAKPELGIPTTGGDQNEEGEETSAGGDATNAGSGAAASDDENGGE